MEAAKSWITVTPHPMAVNSSPTPQYINYHDIISIRAVRLSLIFINAFVILIALAGNGLVMFVICNEKKLRQNATIIFILNLAFSDFMSCLIYKPLILLELFLPFNKHFKFDYPEHHLEICQFTSYFQALFAVVGFFTMTAISQERLFLIVYPLKAKQFWTTGRVKKILAAIWIIAILTVLPIPILYTQVITVRLDGILVSLCGTFEGTLHSHIFHVMGFIIFFTIPMVVMSVSYSKIFFALYYQPTIMIGKEGGNQDRMMQVRRNLAKMMLSVSIIFAMCWGPNFLYFLYLAFGEAPARDGFFIVVFVEFLPIISSALNPFLYTLNSRTFRTAIKGLCMKDQEVPKDEKNSFQSSSTQLKSKSRSQKSLHSFEGTPKNRVRNGHEYQSVAIQPHLKPPGWKFSSEPNSEDDASSFDSDREQNGGCKRTLRNPNVIKVTSF